MFSRLLIANRGEIAVRIARGAHSLGISTVGVHSEVDRDALHVAAVDTAVALGGSSPAESYLRIDALLDAAARTGAEAVHPGYGFLAENAGFARAVIDAGLIWVGPTPEQIELLGDKVAAKRTAVAAGVPSTPAVVVAPGAVPDDLPLPALVKAAAGGGGRGMRIVTVRDELGAAVASASREAEAAFGDGTVFVEPFIVGGRHVEVQVLGDHHGAVVHLGERECSIQRRNQKVIEEAPSPGIDDATRDRLCAGAVALAGHVGYRNAGTVEFMVGDAPDDGADAEPTITFLEVNTRLQVEHPVTEAVTGIDLVAAQLRVAAGEPLWFTQSDVVVRGHAVEGRLVAEDPAAAWMPSTGTLERFAVDTEAVRVDSGVRAGSQITADYDSLLAKVVAHAPARSEAAAVLSRALRRAELAGVHTNADMLAATLGEADFLAGRTTTDYLEHHPEVLAAAGPSNAERDAHLVAAVLAAEAANRRADAHWGFAPSGWRNVEVGGRRSVWTDDALGSPRGVEYRVLPDGTAVFHLGDWPEPDPDNGALGEDTRGAIQVQRGEGWVELDGVRRNLTVHPLGDLAGVGEAAVLVVGDGGRTLWRRRPRFADHDPTESASGPVSPLPGAVVSVHVTSGDTVGDGDLLVVIEAMKMEHRIVARADALVAEVLVADGDRVDAGTLLVRFESET